MEREQKGKVEDMVDKLLNENRMLLERGEVKENQYKK